MLTRGEALALTGDDMDPTEVEAAWERATDEGRIVEFVGPASDLVDEVTEGLSSLDDDHLDRLASAVAAETGRRSRLAAH